MAKLLPLWIIGAPFVYLVFDWMKTPKNTIYKGHTGATLSRGT